MKSSSRVYGKKEFVGILNKAIYSILKYRKQFKSLDKEFVTNIMLAVTEVNGCQLCNYYHTKQAIDSGIDDQELASILSGSLENVKKEEAQALMFAQHYASMKSEYSEETFEKVIAHYGKEKAYGILTAIRLISFGNCYGIQYGNLKSRFTKSGRIEGSKLSTELFILISVVFLVPILVLINLFKK
jgi:AhpD family alkylhydroperoxidase